MDREDGTGSLGGPGHGVAVVEVAGDQLGTERFDRLRPVGGGVTYQRPDTNARREQGAGAALVFDPAHQGQSGGEPRDLEDPYRRGEDISYAIDALSTIPGIDPERIGVLGICAGGGYAVHTARTDHRIKAVGTVVPGNMGTSFRSFQSDGAAAALDAMADARIEETRSGELTRVNWLPDTLEEATAVGLTDIDTTQAITYYRTERGRNEHSTNRRLSRGDSLLLGYDAYHLVDQLMTQPLQVILAGRIGNTGSYEPGTRLWKLVPNPVDLMVIDGAGHYEMYDEPEYVDAAVDRLANFYSNHL
ncbi:alpha/beta hydrolase [Streptomyces sp. NPDC021212]|uniref:alpha/beta hydrolase n=1 Tax=Streptomyces sp. NPDC021212 TaxID=3365118 RepID=UPI00379B703F